MLKGYITIELVMCNDVYGYNNHRFELQPGFAGVLRAEAPLAHLDGSPDLPQAMAT